MLRAVPIIYLIWISKWYILLMPCFYCITLFPVKLFRHLWDFFIIKFFAHFVNYCFPDNIYSEYYLQNSRDLLNMVKFIWLFKLLKRVLGENVIMYKIKMISCKRVNKCGLKKIVKMNKSYMCNWIFMYYILIYFLCFRLVFYEWNIWWKIHISLEKGKFLIVMTYLIL